MKENNTNPTDKGVRSLAGDRRPTLARRRNTLGLSRRLLERRTDSIGYSLFGLN